MLGFGFDGIIRATRVVELTSAGRDVTVRAIGKIVDLVAVCVSNRACRCYRKQGKKAKKLRKVGSHDFWKEERDDVLKIDQNK